MEYKGAKLTPKIALAMTIAVIYAVGPMALIALCGLYYASNYITDPWALVSFSLMLFGMTCVAGKQAFSFAHDVLESNNEDESNEEE